MSKISIVRQAAEMALSAETDRSRCLLGRAEKLTAAALVVSGFQLVAASGVLGSGSPWAEGSVYLALALLALSLFHGFYAMGFKGYADYPRGDKLWEALKPENVSPDSAQEAVIQLLLRNREQNAKLNDAKARSLSRCGWLLFAGFVVCAAGQLLAPLAVIVPPQ